MSTRTRIYQPAIPGLGLVPTASDAAVEEGQDVYSSSAKALALLQGDNLASLTIPPSAAKLPTKEVAGQLQVQPLAIPKIKLATTIPALRKIASRDKLRPALMGVYLDVKKKCCVATNGHMLVVLPDSTLTGENRTISLDNGSVINDRYPDYENVIPIGRTLVGDVSELEALRGRLAGLVRASKFVQFSDGVDIRAEIKVGGRYHYYSCNFLLHVLEALMATGTKAVRLEFDSEKMSRALLIRDKADKKKLAILMPIDMGVSGGLSSSGRAQWAPFCPVLDLDNSQPKAGKPARAKPVVTYQPTKQLLESIGFSPWISDAAATWVQYAHSVNGPWVRVGLFTESQKVRIESVGNDALQTIYHDGVVRNEQEFRQKLALIPWKKFPSYEAGDLVSLNYGGIEVQGLIQPYTGGVPRIKKGIAEVYVAKLNRDLDLPVAQLSLVRRAKDQPAHQDMLPSGRSKPATASKAAKATKPAKAAKAGSTMLFVVGGSAMVKPIPGGTMKTDPIQRKWVGHTGEIVAVKYYKETAKSFERYAVTLNFAGKVVPGFVDWQLEHVPVKVSKHDEPAPEAPSTPKPHTYTPNFKIKQEVVALVAGKKQNAVIDGWIRSESKAVRFLYIVGIDGELTPGVAEKDIAARPQAKAARPKKVVPVDTRAEVPQISPDVLIMQAFLKLENKPVTIDQVRALHRRIEKDFTKQKVRKTSQHADVLRGIAGTVAALFAKMTDKNIGTLDNLEFKTDDAKHLASKAREAVGSVRVGTATTLLSAFVNMQGTVPTEKTVLNLRTKLENEFEEHPNGDFALAVGAAAAVLKDWKAGKPVRVTKQQLSGLAGLMNLGCPDTPPGKACGCSSSAAPKKSTALAGAPEPESGIYPDYLAEAQSWDYNPTPEAAAPVAAETGLFTTIGQKDASRPVGPQLRLPGELGKFLGSVIERHEWALAMRGEKGAGKSRLQYQILNLFAALGLSCALFSLEIDKNSSVVEDYTNAYIAPANRARVKCASEAPGGLKAIREAAAQFDVVAVNSWGKIAGVEPTDFDKIRKEFPATLFVVIFQSTSNGTARGGPSAEYDASAVCQVNLPGLAVMEKNRYAKGPADEFLFDVNAKKLVKNPKYN